MSTGGDGPAFRLEERDGRFAVLAADGRTILECGDRGSAMHYVELLERAHRAGYRQGYRDGKRAGGG